MYITPLHGAACPQVGIEQLDDIVRRVSSKPHDSMTDAMLKLCRVVRNVVPDFDFQQSSSSRALEIGIGNCFVMARLTGRVAQALGYDTFRLIREVKGAPHNSTVVRDPRTGASRHLNYTQKGSISPEVLARSTVFESKILTAIARTSAPKDYQGGVDDVFGTIYVDESRLSERLSSARAPIGVLLPEEIAVHAILDVPESYRVSRYSPTNVRDSRLYIGQIAQNASLLLSVTPQQILSA